MRLQCAANRFPGRGLAGGLGLCLSLLAAAPASAQTTSPGAKAVDPAAVKALGEMSAFLQSHSTFALTSETSLDVVTHDEQKLQLLGTATYKVRKPDAFVIDIVSSSWNRRYIYADRKFTLYAPKLGYYATVPAPATIQATVTEVGDRFGISLPLDDLFRWSGPDGARAESLQSAFLVGPDVIDGVTTNHYAFREGEVDWQIWIQQGAQPLPRQLVIIDRRDSTHPAYTARLTWTLDPSLTDADFLFEPDKNVKKISIITADQGVAP